MHLKLKNGKDALKEPVIEIPSAHKETKKFSVRASLEIQIVHMFKSNNQVYVKCGSGLCQSQFSKKKNVIMLDTCTSLCSHLRFFKSFLTLHRQDYEMLSNINSNISGVDNEEESYMDGNIDEDDEVMNDEVVDETDMDDNIVSEVIVW